MKPAVSALLVLGLLIVASQVAAETLRIQISATLEDKVKLLERLNANGKKRGLHFELTEGDDYKYRIVTATKVDTLRAIGTYGLGGGSASAAVLDRNCELILMVERGGRITKGGALNALTKEIVKQLGRYIELLAATK